MSTQNKSTLEIKDLHVAIPPPEGTEKEILKGVDLTVPQGEVHALMGPNGSGKSSLVKLLSRELYPVVKPGSRLRIFGSETVNLWELRGRIGLVSQDLQAGYVGRVPAADVVLSGFFGSVGIGRSQVATGARATQGLGRHCSARHLRDDGRNERFVSLLPELCQDLSLIHI